MRRVRRIQIMTLENCTRNIERKISYRTYSCIFSTVTALYRYTQCDITGIGIDYRKVTTNFTIHSPVKYFVKMKKKYQSYTCILKIIPKFFFGEKGVWYFAISRVRNPSIDTTVISGTRTCNCVTATVTVINQAFKQRRSARLHLLSEQGGFRRTINQINSSWTTDIRMKLNGRSIITIINERKDQLLKLGARYS